MDKLVIDEKGNVFDPLADTEFGTYLGSLWCHQHTEQKESTKATFVMDQPVVELTVERVQAAIDNLAKVTDGIEEHKKFLKSLMDEVYYSQHQDN